VPFGVGAIEGTAGRALPVLEAGTDAANGNGAEPVLDEITRAATDTNAGIVEPGDLDSEEHRAKALRAEYGPGEEPRPREGEPTASAHGELL
jgi:hypothetical protein